MAGIFQIGPRPLIGGQIKEAPRRKKTSSLYRVSPWPPLSVPRLRWYPRGTSWFVKRSVRSIFSPDFSLSLCLFLCLCLSLSLTLSNDSLRFFFFSPYRTRYRLPTISNARMWKSVSRTRNRRERGMNEIPAAKRKENFAQQADSPRSPGRIVTGVKRNIVCCVYICVCDT